MDMKVRLIVDIIVDTETQASLKQLYPEKTIHEAVRLAMRNEIYDLMDVISIRSELVEDEFIVMRSPCLPEDEGRHFFVKSFRTKKEALHWIESQKAEYFKPSDYYISNKQEE